MTKMIEKNKKKKIEESLDKKIIVRGARTHNLKNVNVEIPRNKLTVFTGLSGSGKSSLAFDTIFAEGQRRYVESLSAYARHFLNQMQKPDVDEITGLSPAISIDQKSAGRNPRSTVATITEIYDYLRVLYARVGKPYCVECGSKIEKLSNDEIINFILEKVQKIDYRKFETKIKSIQGVKFSDFGVRILAPKIRGRKGEYYQLLYDMLGKGYKEVVIDGEKKNLRERIELTKTKKHNISFIVDFILLDELKLLVSKKDAMVRLSESIERALEEADGLVEVEMVNEEGEQDKFIVSNKFACANCGFSFPEIEPRLFSFNSPYGACPTCNGLGVKYFGSSENCPDCKGLRLRKEALNVFLGDKNKEFKKNIVEITSLTIEEAEKYFENVKKVLTKKELEIAGLMVNEIESRLEFMLNVGLNYLSLNRKADTLSGGEAQRIRLASQLGSKLVGALYVLDEPTIGLHQRDNDKLINTLTELRDMGNTIIVVEHDEDTIYASDYIVDIGPGAGIHGGEILLSGYLEDYLVDKTKKSKSLTLAYLRGEEKIEIPKKRREGNGAFISIKNGQIYNIKKMNVKVPLGKFNVITGVSGSGKSSFMYEILYKNLLGRLERKHRTAKVFNCEEITGTEYLSRVILIDQSPIGRTPRSNPVTYTGAWTHIRDLFANTEEARIRGWNASRFSFNRAGGRCEACEGNGEIAVEMHFLPTVYVTCDICNGKRFTKETLEVKYKNKSIYDVLCMPVEEALKFFGAIPAVYDRLKTLNDVGLGYLELGQSATTLSGGEAQRVKISSELYRQHTEKTIYLLDEPSIGLHYEDVKKLLEILNKLVDQGNTVVVIEHNLDIIKNADHVIDIGPEGGSGGGKIVAQGTPEYVANIKESYTGQYLKKALKK
ncbi:MAG TPA: excinuclease ABC subunit UvrA [Candidatus Paceibacterota bacterium]|nr:excinuclease ABC subunit UvrA [Candidatus Paceibacterota bacterium]HQB57031.1 excinuclease ABC subunit UvrA [Candidatus Paceibacterota bacterium]